MDNERMPTGTLIIKAKTGTVDYPVEGVMVTLSSELGQNSRVEAVLTTDASGIAGPVTLLSSGLPLPGEEKKDLLSYTVEADKPGYYSLIRYGVNIFPDTATIQNLFMIPLPVNLEALYNENGEGQFPDSDIDGGNTVYIRPEGRVNR
ncbi:MAG: hypothetical protein E7599_04775 [Ruminococcaceae bacterium]|nr:hypothetical protein [Oscillospiraceae bacterium]